MQPVADPFDSLGLEPRFDLDRRELERRYRDLQRELHPDRHAAESASTRRMALLKAMEVNEAYRALKDDVSRAEALITRLYGTVSTSEADPMFLMEVMELREALSEAKAARDAARVEKLAEQVRSQQGEAMAAIKRDFERAHEGDDSARDALLGGVSKLKYFKRFLTEVQAIEELMFG